MPKNRNIIRVTGFKWYWRVSEGSGGLALLLEDSDPFEAQIPAISPEGLAGMVTLLSSFPQVYFDTGNKVLYTDLLAPGTVKD